ncbi:uncharacterized protein HD556DRAFT_1438366 [Suillus plorans]|uniref:Fungal-type protein kinase domain-containing protein n=1 Tax=Suillus plorans TaxID=116603 RepID=A0A9P7DRP1_9AGAM|nr:uncharacterized protein HD556DRAFT_1438366 [Suillus plorans]KAG1801325.1 hypothetical protein HD556DRAFT_1438366 [Suillus plorans]
MDIDASESESDSDAKTSHSKLNLPMDPPQIEIPEDPLHQPFSEPIGRITVNDHAYDILELIFSSQGLVGRGTVCYLARRDDEEYIIKDHWVLGGKYAVLNEVDMLHEMKGVHGIPELVEYWLVEVAPGEVDETMSYRYKVFESIKGTSRTHLHLVLKPCERPLHAFRTKLELVGALQDIVKIQQTAVEERGILHHDCSLNNAMIWDDGNGGQGTLINWEFAVHIVAGRKYAIGGTGTLPFMSCSLLWQLSEAVGDQVTSLRSWKAKLAMQSSATPPPLLYYTTTMTISNPFSMSSYASASNSGVPSELDVTFQLIGVKSGYCTNGLPTCSETPPMRRLRFFSTQMHKSSNDNSTPTSPVYSRLQMIGTS